jgi:hypothetical protein
MQKKPLWKTVAFAFGLGLSVLSNSGHAAREGRATLCRAFYAEATLESLGQLSRQLQNRLE